MKFVGIFTLIFSMYFLSFFAVSSSLAKPSLVLFAAALLYFPISVLSTRVLKYSFPEKNLFLPFEVSLVISIITNLASINSPPFFAVMFLIQFIIIPLGLIWSAYEFHREGRILPFFVSFFIWVSVVALVEFLFHP